MHHPVTASASMFTLQVGTERQQLPLDCEATSLTIALRAVGVNTSQQYVQSHFPTDLRAPVLGADGLPAQWGDAYSAFVGHVNGSEPGSNPTWTSYPGWGAYAPVIAKAASALGVPVTARSGWNPQDVYAAVEAGHPVLVWTTVSYSTQTPRTWTAWNGRSVPWTLHGHVVVLMGVDRAAARLLFSDPLTGTYNGTSMARFERTFAYYGNMALVVERVAHATPVMPRPTARSAPKPVVPPKPAPLATPSPTSLALSDALLAKDSDRELMPTATSGESGRGPSRPLSSRVSSTPAPATPWWRLGLAAALMIAGTGVVRVLVCRRRSAG